MDAQFRKIVSGENNGFGASSMRTILGAAAQPYRLALALRNGLYDAGIIAAHRMPVPVVSIGNITLVGTGKTPFVEYVCGWFLARGSHPVILSRGYRSKGGQNDEAMLLAANLPGVPHLQGKDRVALARQACNPDLPDSM